MNPGPACLTRTYSASLLTRSRKSSRNCASCPSLSPLEKTKTQEANHTRHCFNCPTNSTPLIVTVTLKVSTRVTPLYRLGNQGPNEVNEWPNVPQLLSGGAGILVGLIPKSRFYLHPGCTVFPGHRQSSQGCTCTSRCSHHRPGRPLLLPETTELLPCKPFSQLSHPQASEMGTVRARGHPTGSALSPRRSPFQPPAILMPAPAPS